MIQTKEISRQQTIGTRGNPAPVVCVSSAHISEQKMCLFLFWLHDLRLNSRFISQWNCAERMGGLHQRYHILYQQENRRNVFFLSSLNIRLHLSEILLNAAWLWPTLPLLYIPFPLKVKENNFEQLKISIPHPLCIYCSVETPVWIQL